MTLLRPGDSSSLSYRLYAVLGSRFRRSLEKSILLVISSSFILLLLLLLLLFKLKVHIEPLAMTDTWSSAVAVGLCLQVVPRGPSPPSIFCMIILVFQLLIVGAVVMSTIF
jgi:hypothetical protein